MKRYVKCKCHTRTKRMRNCMINDSSLWPFLVVVACLKYKQVGMSFLVQGCRRQAFLSSIQSVTCATRVGNYLLYL